MSAQTHKKRIDDDDCNIGAAILGDASIYLGEQYPFIKTDVFRETPERRAAEIICALKDIIELSDWDVDYSMPKRR